MRVRGCAQAGVRVYGHVSVTVSVHVCEHACMCVWMCTEGMDVCGYFNVYIRMSVLIQMWLSERE